MIPADRDAWEYAGASWNASMSVLSSNKRLADELSMRLSESGCYYRFSADRYRERESREEDCGVKRLIRHKATKDEGDYFEVPLATALRPAFLPDELLTRIKGLGMELESLLQLSNSYLFHERAILSYFGSSLKGEFEWIDLNRKLSPITQWLRIDYIWKWESDAIEIKLVDINLLPGAAFLSERLARTSAAVFSEFGLCSDPSTLELLNTSVLVRNMLAHFSLDNSQSQEELRLAILMRNLHGLSAEAGFCSEALREAASCRVDVTSPVILAQHFFDRPTENRTFHGIVRMSRPVSKHATGKNGEMENAAFLKLMSVFKNVRLYPTFNAYLENHTWFHVWQTDPFAQFARDVGCGDVLDNIRTLLPRTSVITPKGDLIAAKEIRPLANADFHDSVLKRGNSTGGQDLKVFWRSSSGQVERALKMVRSEPGAGWVLQELIAASKEVFPVFTKSNPSAPSFIEGFMMHSAYYSNGTYFGSHAVMTPSSRKVHGGFDSYVIPVFPIP